MGQTTNREMIMGVRDDVRKLKLEEQAREVGKALEEARSAYNDAKRGGRAKVRLTTRTVYLLVVGACKGFDVPLSDASTGRALHDPREDAPPVDPSTN